MKVSIQRFCHLYAKILSNFNDARSGPARPKQERIAELADPDSQFVVIDGLTVHYKKAGEGTPARLVRRFLADNTSLTSVAWHDPTKVTPEIIEGYGRYLRLPDWDKALR